MSPRVGAAVPAASSPATGVAFRTAIVPAARPTLAVLLAAATFMTMTLAGAVHRSVDLRARPGAVFEGVPYALALFLILAVHELGHYWMARRRGVPVSLPYMIPAPSSLGTFGAFIRLGYPVRTRSDYLDVGLAGPFAGLVMAASAVVVGTAAGEPVMGHGMLPRSSSLFALLYTLAGGGPIDAPLQLGAVAFAGWIGLVVTALNLVPIGQLDGGHAAYALLGARRARLLGSGVVSLLVVAGVLGGDSHLLTWGIIAYLLAGTAHPPAQDERAAPSLGRVLVGLAALAVLLAIVLPAPG